jgi:hypothetical protein
MREQEWYLGIPVWDSVREFECGAQSDVALELGQGHMQAGSGSAKRAGSDWDLDYEAPCGAHHEASLVQG